MAPALSSKLKTEDLELIGRMQRGIAKAHIQADMNGKRLEIWLREADKEEHETKDQAPKAASASVEDYAEQNVQDNKESTFIPPSYGEVVTE